MSVLAPPDAALSSDVVARRAGAGEARALKVECLHIGGDEVKLYRRDRRVAAAVWRSR